MKKVKTKAKKVTKKKTGMSAGKKVAIGAGVVAASALTAGAYYLLGPNAKAHQKKASVLMTKMEREVLSKIKKAKKMSLPIYHKAVDVVSENYAKQYKAHEKDIKIFAKQLKSKWNKIK